ncbi:bifunctional diguanylate cyclase/phosphodiesterase [Catenulispora sp. NF23]|uniref:Bifunctional diguanylate cyclase/phosphodiesterase n=1 Tax=Catenulispora pinistramenti TaxID=2705254 RepID=A0ABS5L5I2_9ACTN|nr:bifunctional diguanylate cyclase/phosphodiesterase [Catenulispora pinistramenti]MBS2539865.1 bifunctional diguanylate cyclase/phosphodiesterase [Catenulispora pinistramenti]MBS2553601.1 bifunctional diguanylate cyclase/phosphodiesterase [Catenulispora pinistramenti]
MAHAEAAASRSSTPFADELTGLPNRAMLGRWLEARTGTRARPGQRIGLCSLDLDGFRQINALLGFGAGDRFLAAVAARLRTVLEPGGHLLARTGGDEFAVLVDYKDHKYKDHKDHPVAVTDPAGAAGAAGAFGTAAAAETAASSASATGAAQSAESGAPQGAEASQPRRAPGGRPVVERVAERVLAALRDPLRVDGRDLTVTASIGAVEALAAASAPEDLLRAADLALYWAKGEGRDRWTLFDAERAGADVARYRLAADLPAAVESGQFYCEYQPIVSLADGAVSGVEALVRWRHPRFGIVPPDRFIALAEESGLIVELGRRILSEACQAAATWPDAPGQPAPPVSVNVAVRQCRDPRLMGHVLSALAESGLAPQRLRLEITESALLPGDDAAQATLRALADKGVAIAVDDFGTGYSNLSHLRRLPVHILKIDGTFVAGLASASAGVAGSADGSGAAGGSGTGPGDVGADEQIIATVTALGHALGLTVTAEGVETAGQLETVRRLGVDTGQGWLFSRALPAAGIRDLLARGAPLAA